MSGEDVSKGLPQSAAAKFPGEILFRRVEISARTITGETFIGIRADRATIADSLFRDCVFNNCSFRTADFEAATFENCSFLTCNFSTADFRSAEFSQCQIDSCNFSGGSVTASRFQSCSVTGGKFDRQTLDENVWVDCELFDMSFRRATLMQMKFERCRFIKVDFADCTSLYHFFDDCEFEAGRMNVDSVALSFGLTRENLGALTLVWQGLRQRTPRNISLLLDQLLESIAVRRWGVATAALGLNFSLLGAHEALRLAFAPIQEAIDSERRLRSDEVRFLAHLIDRLAEREELPFLAIAEGLELCARAEDSVVYHGEGSLKSLAFRPNRSMAYLVAK